MRKNIEQGIEVDEKARIMLVEDEWIIASDIQNSLEGMGYEVTGIAVTGEEAVRRAGEEMPDLVLMDIVLQGPMDGVSAACEIRKAHNLPVVFLTAYTDESVYGRAILAEPFGYIVKPFEERELQITLEMALYKHRMERELRKSEQRFRTLMEYAADAFIVYDHKGTILDVNRNACTMLMASREELLGRNIGEIDPQRGGTEVEGLWKEVVSGGSATFETTYRLMDGSMLPVEVRVGLLEEKDELLMLAQARDITERKRIEDEREGMIKELEVALKDKAQPRNNLPVCVLRKKPSNDEDTKSMIRAHYDAIIAHGVCKDCLDVFRNISGLSQEKSGCD